MATDDFITNLFCRVGDRMKTMPNYSQVALWPSEGVTSGLLLAVSAYNPNTRIIR